MMRNEQVVAKMAELRDVVLDLCSDDEGTMKEVLESLRKARRLAYELEDEILQRVLRRKG